MRAFRKSRSNLPSLAPWLAVPLFAALTAAGALPTAQASSEVKLLILKENGSGSASTAQGYVDKLMASVARQQGWTASSGKYETHRSNAKTWIASNNPQFGILSLGAFLAFDADKSLEIIGKADIKGAGGSQYFIVSTTHDTLAGCKGKSLATNHADDARFIDKVVSARDFDLADFQVVETRRPVQTIKAVTRGEAECALIDDAQAATMKRVDGGAALNKVWSSKALPPMVVVAFPGAGAEKGKFKSGLGKICSGEGQSACAEVGLRKLSASSGSEYKAVRAAYK